MECSRHVALAVAALLFVSCRTVKPGLSEPDEPSSAEPVHLTVVGTNDVHGWAYPRKTVLGDGTAVEEGGLQIFSAYLSILRQDNPGGVLLIDSGDIFQGTLAANITEGAFMIDAYNYLGYQAVAVGNHEFDYGPVGPAVMASAPGDDPLGALKARIAQAKFPFLAGNVLEAASGVRPRWLGNDGSILLELKGVKVGLVGLITPTTPQVTNPVNVASLKFGALAPSALQAAQRLRERGATVLIGIAHAGGRCSSVEDPSDLSSCDLDNGEIFEMIRGLPEGTFDGILAGHTHSSLGHFVNGMPVVETWGLGRHFSVIDLSIDPKTKRVLRGETRLRPLIPICERVDAERGGCNPKGLADGKGLVPAVFMGREVKRDLKLEELMRPTLVRLAEEQRRPLGLSAPRLLGRNYDGESALGDFLADSLREMEKADVSLLNAGGLRADLPAGELTYGDVYEVMPFENAVATLSLNADELNRLLRAAYGSRKGVFPVSGLAIELSPCPGEGRLRSFALGGGRALSANKRYKVVLPDFLARGGDGLDKVMASFEARHVDLGDARARSLRDSLVQYWQEKRAPLVAPKPGRIAFNNDSKRCRGANYLDAARQ